jgi:hypothetical protein
MLVSGRKATQLARDLVCSNWNLREHPHLCCPLFRREINRRSLSEKPTLNAQKNQKMHSYVDC